MPLQDRMKHNLVKLCINTYLFKLENLVMLLCKGKTFLITKVVLSSYNYYCF